MNINIAAIQREYMSVKTLSQKIAELKTKTADEKSNYMNKIRGLTKKQIDTSVGEEFDNHMMTRRNRSIKEMKNYMKKHYGQKQPKIDCPQMKLEALKEKVAAGEIDNSRDYGGEYDRSMQRKKELKKRRPSFEIIPKGEYAPGKKY